MQLTYVEHSGTDLSVVNAARVSFGKRHTEFHPEKDTKLINYLARGCTSGDWQGILDEIAEAGKLAVDDGDWTALEEAMRTALSLDSHHSPFNHCFLTCHVKAPIFVARQLVKHEYMPWNEISRRYVDDEPEFYTPPNNEWWAKSSDKKQGRSKAPVDYGTIADYLDTCLYQYKDMLNQGMAPEQARMVLPLNTYTEWYWSGTLGAWMKMYNLRAKEDTQEETRTIARMAGEVLQSLYPVSFEALRKV